MSTTRGAPRRGVGVTAGYIPAANMAEGIDPISVITLQANIQIPKQLKVYFQFSR